ncbi:TPA: hypothetical protein ACKMPP_002062, partial [Neisseria gonorrhoeae]
SHPFGRRSKISRCRVLPESRHMAGKLRHSRESGNPDLRTTAIFKDYLKVRDSGFPLSRE